MNSYRIRTSGMLGSYWSTMLPSRCTRRIVLWQFGFLQLIFVAPEVLNEEHKIELRRLNTHWPIFHLEYIEMWENRYDNIPTHEPIIIPELACKLDYIPWFRIHGNASRITYHDLGSMANHIYSRKSRG
ncbi:hypothetical protein Golax_009190, partial [Gossypium laxum]|nr:hypothetical protein [Gossypium laxum]